MLATAGSAIAAVNILKDWGLKRIKLCCICASSVGVHVFRESHPDVDLYVGVEDEILNDHGYIVPVRSFRALCCILAVQKSPQALTAI